jgi:hypothetical protein
LPAKTQRRRNSPVREWSQVDIFESRWVPNADPVSHQYLRRSVYYCQSITQGYPQLLRLVLAILILVSEQQHRFSASASDLAYLSLALEFLIRPLESARRQL